MGASTVIEWTDATENFWRGCEKVSPGCAHCYMFRDQRRYGRDPSVVVRCSPATFNAPVSAKWRLRAEQIAAEQGRRMRVFTCSWSDFFHPDADAWRDEAWAIIRGCPQYDWQILTKRPELVAERLPADWGDGWPHVWLGVSIENRRFVHRADRLRALPAAVRFISAEPLLGPLIGPDEIIVPTAGRGFEPVRGWTSDDRLSYAPSLDLEGISWLIVGGESGGPAGRRLVDATNQPRADRLAWVRDLRDATRWPCNCCRVHVVGGVYQHDHAPECDAHGGDTAFLFKQWGGARPESGGRLLDGREWSEFPTSPAALVVA